MIKLDATKLLGVRLGAAPTQGKVGAVKDGGGPVLT